MSVASRSADVRRHLDHPVIDADAHTSEFTPALAEYLREVGISTDFNALFRGVLGAVEDWYELSPDERVRRHRTKAPWWTRPMRDARDRAAACFPRYLRERMDEVGCDVSVVYPSTGLAFLQLPSEELRRGACRALNRYHRDAFQGCLDRLVPVAAVPANTPQEAVEELDHAVLEQGFRAVVLPSYVPRPVPALAQEGGEVRRWAFWLDCYGLDSPHDYDPLWRRCVELGVSVATHTQGNGWGSRRSPSSWVYNHIGHFAASGEAACKALFLGGVTRRFPGLRVAFLEGGVGWACSLYADLVHHFEKRNVRAIRENLDPALLDEDEFRRLAERYATLPGGSGAATGALLTSPGLQRHRPSDAELDEFAALRIEHPEEIAPLFAPSFFFGCEADDPMTAVAFRRGLLPFGARLAPIYGSDIGHFDVPDLSEVLHEAWEGVERGLITREDFRELVFDNPARFYTDSNPDFFAGTVVADAVARLRGSEFE